MNSWRYILLAVSASLYMAAPAWACDPPANPDALDRVPDALQKETDVILVAKVSELSDNWSRKHCDPGIAPVTSCAEYSVTLKDVKVSHGTFGTQSPVVFLSYASAITQSCDVQLMNTLSEGRLEEVLKNGKKLALYLSLQETDGQTYYRLEGAYTDFRTR